MTIEVWDLSHESLAAALHPFISAWSSTLAAGVIYAGAGLGDKNMSRGVPGDCKADTTLFIFGSELQAFDPSVGLWKKLAAASHHLLVESVYGCAASLTLIVCWMTSQGVEATLYATLMSILNAGGFTSQAIGAGLTKVICI